VIFAPLLRNPGDGPAVNQCQMRRTAEIFNDVKNVPGKKFEKPCCNTQNAFSICVISMSENMNVSKRNFDILNCFYTRC